MLHSKLIFIMRKFKFTILSLLALATVMGCADSLNVAPKQVLDESLLTKPSDMEGFVTAAYARITDIPSWDSPFSPWWTGTLRSDDSYKGGGGTWAGDGWHKMAIFGHLKPDRKSVV